jgi:hypothetical protein
MCDVEIMHPRKIPGQRQSAAKDGWMRRKLRVSILAAL